MAAQEGTWDMQKLHSKVRESVISSTEYIIYYLFYFYFYVFFSCPIFSAGKSFNLEYVA